MKYLKSFKFFETVGFGNNITGIGSDEATFDHSNSPVLKQQVENYVDSMLGSEITVLCKKIGVQAPKDLQGAEMDDFADKVREKAIAFFMKNPAHMDANNDREIKKDLKHTMDDTDRVPTTNNIGGTSFANSNHIGQ
jgi:hypothetical protein